MKHVLVAGLLAVTAIAISEPAVHAQSSSRSLGSTTPQSAPLVTRPASINSPSGYSQSSKPYTAEQLNSALGTLEANPKPQKPQQGNSLESLIEKFTPDSAEPKAVDPIDFFKPPALDGGVKVPIQ